MPAPEVNIAETSHTIAGRGMASITITIQRRNAAGVLEAVNLSATNPTCTIRDPIAQDDPIDDLLEDIPLVIVAPLTGTARLDLNDARLALLQRPGPPEATADYLARCYVPEIDYYPDRFWLYIEYAET